MCDLLDFNTHIILIHIRKINFNNNEKKKQKQ